MKKFVLFIGLTVVITMALAAQAGGTVEQRLVGTWTNLHDNTTVNFNANGTVSGFPLPSVMRRAPTHWVAAGNRIILFIPWSAHHHYVASSEFTISSDGEILIIAFCAFRRN